MHEYQVNNFLKRSQASISEMFESLEKLDEFVSYLQGDPKNIDPDMADSIRSRIANLISSLDEVKKPLRKVRRAIDKACPP